MNEFGDYKSEMFNEPLSDEAIEAIVDGARSAPESFAFARLTNDINRVATGPMPMPSAALAAMMQMNISTETLMQQMVASDETFVADDSQLSFWRRKKMAIGQFITGLGIVGKLTLGTGVAFASTAGAAGAGVLPAPVQHEVSRVVETVTPFKVRDPKAERAEKKREEERVTPPSTLPTPTTLPPCSSTPPRFR